ncbi:hypothetical protein R3P38DRAFT_3242489 [Favolaschia claudopus]|uniref:DUF6589 domain-containing protein n=1 Tax=Favolaschia claudopus TaxID=2862362 RepID=A0AAV9Z4J2_9AGAR
MQEFLVFLFESTIPKVKHRAGLFMGSHPSHEFAPQRIFKAWHDRFPKSVPHLHSTIISLAWTRSPYSRAIKSSTTAEHPRPREIARNLSGERSIHLGVFTTSPNEYRKKQARKTLKTKVKTPTEPDEWDETAGGPEEDADSFVGESGGFWKDMGFARNATFALVFVFGIMAFTRDTGANVFPMILGLFLEIGGTSSRILATLSSAGACVSITAIERLKKILSEDAVAHAKRLFIKNSMIHATNAAVIALSDAVYTAENLEAKQKLRGKRAAATGADIIPTDEDKEKMYSSFVGIVMTLIIAYCPGNEEWKERDEMLKAAEDTMASDRPLQPKKSDARPAGVFDVNEGSKKGIIEMLESLQEFTGVDKEQWSSKARIIVGDWLTSNNIRGARRDRMDDVTPMERLEYVEELSALWHFALNATHMIMRLHFGDSVLDPGSLAKHKGLLNRIWDAEKSNYADAKALIRHSLIARILYQVMLKKDIRRWAYLAKWRPTLAELEGFSREFVSDFTEARNIQTAKNINDDYYAL